LEEENKYKYWGCTVDSLIKLMRGATKLLLISIVKEDKKNLGDHGPQRPPPPSSPVCKNMNK